MGETHVFEGSGDEFHQLVFQARQGDKLAQEKLVESNMGLVWSIVRRFSNRGHDMEDLFQIGCMGLLKAIDKFDVNFGVRFSTYAVPMIMGEIKRFLRDDGIIKVSRSLKEIAGRAGVVKEALQKELNRDPTLSEIAAKLEISAEELAVALDAGIQPESLYASVGDSDSSPVLLIDRIDGEVNKNAMDVVDKIALEQVLKTLPKRERQIIFLRYFKEKTQVQIAKILGISQVQVSRIERKILDDLKRKIIQE